MCFSSSVSTILHSILLYRHLSLTTSSFTEQFINIKYPEISTCAYARVVPSYPPLLVEELVVSSFQGRAINFGACPENSSWRATDDPQESTNSYYNRFRILAHLLEFFKIKRARTRCHLFFAQLSRNRKMLFGRSPCHVRHVALVRDLSEEKRGGTHSVQDRRFRPDNFRGGECILILFYKKRDE